MDAHGSIWFTLTWRRWNTPSGRRLFVLQAKAHPTRGTGFGSLLPCPTPTAVDGKGSGRKRLERGMNNNLRDWFKINFNFLYPPVGLRALVDGVSGRTPKLRAYGNAIVPQVAQAFIEAYMEVAGL